MYADAEIESSEYDISAAIARSLEKRWKPADQDMFDPAIILNRSISRHRLCFKFHYKFGNKMAFIEQVPESISVSSKISMSMFKTARQG